MRLTFWIIYITAAAFAQQQCDVRCMKCWIKVPTRLALSGIRQLCGKAVLKKVAYANFSLNNNRTYSKEASPGKGGRHVLSLA